MVIDVLSSKEPIKINSFKIAGKKIQSGEKFIGSDDWLKDLQIDFENISGKTATHIGFVLWFPRSEEQKDIAPLFFTIFRGDRSEAMRRLSSGFEIRADSGNNKATVTLLPQDYENIRYYLNKLNYPTRTEQVKIYLQVAVFDDGTVWESGSWYKIDPTNPKNLIEIKGDEDIALNLTKNSCVKVAPVYNFCGISVPGFRCNRRSVSVISL